LNDSKVGWDWCALLIAINRQIAMQHMEDKQLGPWFIKPSLSGEIDYEEFLNKCLFYLWHDVYKDDQIGEHSPFLVESSQNSFYLVQEAMRFGGLAAGLKAELLAKVSKSSGESPSLATESGPLAGE